MFEQLLWFFAAFALQLRKQVNELDSPGVTPRENPFMFELFPLLQRNVSKLGSILGRLGAPVVTVVTILCSAAWVSAEERITIRLLSGREFRGFVHAQTNQDQLWFQYGSESIAIIRGIEWTHVVSAKWNERELTADELKQLVPQIVQRPLPRDRRVAASSPNTASFESIDRGRFDGRRAGPYDVRPASAMLPRDARRDTVRGVSFDARLANWDADAEFDGLLLHVTPFDEFGSLVYAQGIIEVSVYGPASVGSLAPMRSNLYSLQKIGVWSESLTNFSPNAGGFLVKVPLPVVALSSPRGTGVYGLVHVRLVVPGDGVFEASRDGVRLQNFTPTLDRFHLNGGTGRFPR